MTPDELAGLPKTLAPVHLRADRRPAPAPDATELELAKKLIPRVHRLTHNSPALKELRQEHQGLCAELRERGVTYVLAAGNSGEFAEALQRKGVPLPEDFFWSVLHSKHTLIVGATDPDGVRPASFSTPQRALTWPCPGSRCPFRTAGTRDIGSSRMARRLRRRSRRPRCCPGKGGTPGLANRICLTF